MNNGTRMRLGRLRRAMRMPWSGSGRLGLLILVASTLLLFLPALSTHPLAAAADYSVPTAAPVVPAAVALGGALQVHAIPHSPDDPDWLQEINKYRAASGLSLVTDNTAWDAGIQDHLTYLADTPGSYFSGAYQSLHTENPASPYYTAAGAHEAASSDLVEGAIDYTDVQVIDIWLAAPFHAQAILQPDLQEVAFAFDPDTGDAGLDVLSGLTGATIPTTPTLFPGPSMTTDLDDYSEGEAPSPLQSCGSTTFSGSPGLPLIALLTSAPSSDLTATLTGSNGIADSSINASLCVVDSSTYYSTDPVYGPTGAAILSQDNAVFLIPEQPLAAGTYTATISQPGESDITWSFRTVNPLSCSNTCELATATVNQPYTTSLTADGGTGPYTWSTDPTLGSLPSGLTLSSDGVVSGIPTEDGFFSIGVTITDSEAVPPASLSTQAFLYVQPSQSSGSGTPSSARHGYWLVGSDGGIFSFGSAQFYGSTGSLKLQRPVVGIVPTADKGGYWLDASDGGVFAYGDTQYYGSIPGLGLHPAGSGLPNSLDAPIVAMVPSNDDGGYFMVASDGGVFAFGDAHFAGSCPGIGGCSGAAVAVMPDASGNGYWLVTKTGTVYTFGDASYYGAPGNTGSPVTSAVRTPNGGGYWILTADGTVYNYGDAGNYGDAAGAFGGFNPATAIFTTSDGAGYWIASANGTVDQYGDAPNDGDMSGTNLNGSIIAATGF